MYLLFKQLYARDQAIIFYMVTTSISMVLFFFFFWLIFNVKYICNVFTLARIDRETHLAQKTKISLLVR